MTVRHFGEIEGVLVGDWFESREAVAKAGIHRPLVAGICGGAWEGAESIVVNGGYVDDEDHGDEIIYTGAGGNDTTTKRQVADQSFSHTPNAALVMSEQLGQPVRVVRGFKGDPRFSPEGGYRYDGLFAVVEHWDEPGRDGFRVCRFKMRALARSPQPVLPAISGEELDSQLSWVLEFDAYERVAGEPRWLEAVLRPARDLYAATGEVPLWCGSDLLRAWAFFLAREHGQQGGSPAGQEWKDVLQACCPRSPRGS